MRVQHEMTPLVETWLKGTKGSPHTAQQTVGRVMERVPHTTQRRRRWSDVLRASFVRPSQEGRPMFSAVKIVAAAAIVALSGGLLINGVLTTPDIAEAPAASAEAPSPVTPDELLSGLVAEEVEPGVLRIVDDGLKDLQEVVRYPMGFGPDTLLAGHDGSVWTVSPDGLRRLGGTQSLATPSGWEQAAWNWGSGDGAQVAPDGTPWVLFHGREGTADEDTWSLRAYQDGTWQERLVRDGNPYQPLIDFRVQSDGTVWALTKTDGPGGYRFLRLEGDRWARIPKPPAPADNPDHQIRSWEVAPDGTLWMARKRDVSRYDGKRWQTVARLPKNPGNKLVLAPDGTVLSYLRDSIRTLAADGSWNVQPVSPLPYDANSAWAEPVLAPDGALWRSLESMEFCGIMCARLVSCGGVARFDGAEWTRYLDGRCVNDIVVDADGNAWVDAAGTVPGETWIREDGTEVETIERGMSELYLVRPEPSTSS